MTHVEGDAAVPIGAVVEAYQGEVFGLAMYRIVADAQTDPWRRWQWECMYRLEAELHDELAWVLRRLGVEPVPDEREASAGRAEAERIIGLAWPEFLDEFAVDLPGLVADYTALAEAPGFAAEDRAVLRRVALHEVAALDYCDAEREGTDPERSIAGVVELLREVPERPYR